MPANEDLFTLALVDGLPVQSEGRTLKYKRLRLREIGVGDERIATQLSERVVNVGGRPTLLVSSSDHRYALTMRHIEKFTCEGLGDLGQDVINLDLIDKLSPHDWGLIEERVFVINVAAKLRYGLITQDEFDLIISGQSKPPSTAPQPEGQAAELGATAAGTESGPALLTDFTRQPVPLAT